VVLRDYEGEFIAAHTSYLPHVISAQVLEALAMKEGLSLANEMGISNLIAESDSSKTVEACSTGHRGYNDSSAIFADCVDLIAGMGNVKFKQCPREANKVVDKLARLCFQSPNSCKWVDEPP
jgi:ribonuclease HI